MAPSTGCAFLYVCRFCGSISYSLLSVHFPSVKFRLLRKMYSDGLFTQIAVIPRASFSFTFFKQANFFFFFFFADGHVFEIVVFGDLNNSYHNSCHLLKLHTSLSFCENILKGKTERILSTPTELETSDCFNICSQSGLSVLFSSVFVQKSGRRSLIQIAYPFPVAVFSGNRGPCPWFRGCSGGGRESG